MADFYVMSRDTDLGRGQSNMAYKPLIMRTVYADTLRDTAKITVIAYARFSARRHRIEAVSLQRA